MTSQPTLLHWQDLPTKNDKPILVYWSGKRWYRCTRDFLQFHHVFPWREEYLGFENAPPPVYPRTIHYNAKPPCKTRKHVHRHHIATWEDDWYNHARYRVNHQSEQPSPDGA